MKLMSYLLSALLDENGIPTMLSESFGGDYIDEGYLHVCIVNLSSSDCSSYKTIVKDYLDIVIFEDVDYPLLQLIESSRMVADELIRADIPVYSSASNEVGNCVVISTDINQLADGDFNIEKSSVCTMPVALSTFECPAYQC